MMNRILFILIIIFFSVNTFSQEKLKTGAVRNHSGIDMVYIEPGTFIMGSKSEGNHSPAREVSITRGFWIGRYEITQEQYMEITGSNPAEKSRYGQGDRLPVYRLSWYDAVEFCNLLSEKHGLKRYYEIDKTATDPHNKFEFDEYKWTVRRVEGADGFRLPTEAEWEYAARGGTKTDFHWGRSSAWKTAGVYAWHLFNAGRTRYRGDRFWWVKYHKYRNVGTKRANPWGLFDVSGNVAEWCWDRYDADYYGTGDNTDPAGPDGDYMFRVKRGGSILDAPADMASWRRWPISPAERSDSAGIRVILPEQ